MTDREFELEVQSALEFMIKVVEVADKNNFSVDDVFNCAMDMTPDEIIDGVEYDVIEFRVADLM